MSGSKTVCYCRKVDFDTIIKAIENGADDLDKVKEATGAATACGRCKSTIKDIIDSKK
ncbi:MAG: (2Fe-2S)-binding protein [Clostridium sp.]|nr:(2Fe-2S)-binding protein [Clostridium sp.]